MSRETRRGRQLPEEEVRWCERGGNDRREGGIRLGGHRCFKRGGGGVWWAEAPLPHPQVCCEHALLLTTNSLVR
jgi:hypothetical protein